MSVEFFLKKTVLEGCGKPKGSEHLPRSALPGPVLRAGDVATAAGMQEHLTVTGVLDSVHAAATTKLCAAVLAIAASEVQRAGCAALWGLHCHVWDADRPQSLCGFVSLCSVATAFTPACLIFRTGCRHWVRRALFLGWTPPSRWPAVAKFEAVRPDLRTRVEHTCAFYVRSGSRGAPPNVIA